MPDTPTAHQIATELFATCRGRHAKEPVQILAERAKIIAEAVLNMEKPAIGQPLDDIMSKPSVIRVKNPSEETLRLLEAGPCSIRDLQQALGHPNSGATKTLVKSLVKKGRAIFDEEKLEVSLVA